MAVRKVNRHDIEPKRLEGRDLRLVVTPETIGAERLSIAIMNCFPRATLRPVHAHKDTEEVILVLAGQGEVWIDGERSSFKEGDAVLFPANSKHQLRNTGDTDLVTASIFSPPTEPGSYILYDEDAFPEAE